MKFLQINNHCVLKIEHAKYPYLITTNWDVREGLYKTFLALLLLVTCADIVIKIILLQKD